ncbi:MAG: hypothetical protein QXP71_02930 [Desulfurococcaceae archaeon]
MIRFKIFLLLLTIIAIVATFYVPPAILNILVRSYKDTASPYNIGWNGTASLLFILDAYPGIDIIIVNNDDELIRELEKNGLLLLVSPDYSFNEDICDRIEKLYRSGFINIAVFDENITLNNLLSRFGLRIVGKAVLETVVKSEPYYPYATIIDLNNTIHVFRLNIGSPVQYSVSIENIKILSTSYGLLDENNNGRQDDNVIGNFTIGVLLNEDKGYILVFGDSYPLTNSGLSLNLTVSRVLIEYIVHLAYLKNNRIIIPNYLYRQTTIGFRDAVVHPSLFFIALANGLRNFDIYLTSVLSKFPLTILLFLITIISIIFFNRLFRYIMGIGEIQEYRLTRVKRYHYVVGSIITRDLWSKEIIGGLEKELVLKYWSTLVATYKTIKNIDLNDVLVLKNNDLLIRIGFNKEQIKKLYWMKRIVDKITDRKRFPIIINWKSVVKDFIIYLEDFLNILGYTIMNKSGFRNVSSIIK